jgi:hypothetical protein
VVALVLADLTVQLLLVRIVLRLLPPGGVALGMQLRQQVAGLLAMVLQARHLRVEILHVLVLVVELGLQVLHGLREVREVRQRCVVLCVCARFGGCGDGVRREWAKAEGTRARRQHRSEDAVADGTHRAGRGQEHREKEDRA